MAVDRTMGVQEAAVSSETAISCLTLLSSQIGADVDAENVRSRQQFRSPTLPISELIELANDFGFKAQYIHRDWPWLQMAVGTQPILLLLKNGNIIVAVGVGRSGAEEIVVSDPLHRSGALIILSRGNIERAWDGDAVTIVPKIFIGGSLDNSLDMVVSEQLSNKTGKTQKFWKLFAIILLCLGSVAVVSALITLPIAEKPVASQKLGPVVPAIAPLHSTIANGAGDEHASDQEVKATPTASLAYTVAGSIAAGAVSLLLDASLPSNPKNPEAPSVPSIAQVTAEPNVAALAASPRAPLGTVVPAQIAASAIIPPLTGSQPAREGSGLSDNAKLSASDIAALLARGDDQLRLGDVTSARLFYEHAADAGDANAALRLAETFDPIFLGRANLHGVSGDMERALFWYFRARDFGSKEAATLLKELTVNNGVSH